MRPYRYTVDDAVLQEFSSVSKRHREKLLRIFDQLLADPYQPGDTTQRDAVGRTSQVLGGQNIWGTAFTWSPSSISDCRSVYRNS